ncbi:MAG: CarD family transcriptional regulator, partial [Acidobacteriota bacterium]
YRLASGLTSITVTPIGSVLLRTYAANFNQQLALALQLNEEIGIEDLAEHLRRIGYTERDPVEMVGEFSVRGGIVDIFPAESARPLRLEFFGDAIDSMRLFDVETQRSVQKVDRAVILPLVEHPKPANPVPAWEFTRVLAEPRPGTLLDLAAGALVVIDEPEQVRSAADRMWKRLGENQRDLVAPPEDLYLTWTELAGPLEARRRVTLRQVELLGESGAGQTADLHTRPAPAFHGNLPNAVAETRKLVEQGYKVVYFAPAVGEVERLADILHEYSVPFQLALSTEDTVSPFHAERARLFGGSASTLLARGRMARGTVLTEAKLAIIGSDDLFDSSDLVADPGLNKRAAAAFAADIADLKPGDYVVHVTHGVGRFLGIKEIPQGDQQGDFLILEYAGESKLYVPMTRLDLVQKFRGAGEGTPPLDRMGGATWAKTKSRVKAKMRDMADELLKLYAERRMAAGFQFSPDSNWQREFEDAFPYTATKD